MLAKHEGKRPLGNPMRKLEEMLNSNFKTQGGWLAGGEGGTWLSTGTGSALL